MHEAKTQNVVLKDLTPGVRAEEQEIAMAVLDAMILKHQVAGALERVRKPAARTTRKPRERLRA